MSFSNFKKVEDVADEFGIKTGMGHFIDTLDIKVSESKLAEIRNAFDDSMNFVNEVAVCEMIIRPILNVVGNQYERLHITKIKKEINNDYKISDDFMGVYRDRKSLGFEYCLCTDSQTGAGGMGRLCLLSEKRF